MTLEEVRRIQGWCPGLAFRRNVVLVTLKWMNPNCFGQDYPWIQLLFHLPVFSRGLLGSSL